MLPPARAGLATLSVIFIAIACGGTSGPNPPPPPPPPTPGNLAKQAGDNQTAEPGTAVPVPPSVKVTTSSGSPVSGVTVTFAVASGGGTVTGATPTTGADGVATVGSWTLGPSAGSNTLTATIAGTGITGNPATFTANGQLTAFNPSSNTSLSGTRNFASVNIPAGVTITASADLVLNATGAITVAGGLVGSCVALTVSADGALTVSGTINNGCPGGAATLPAMTLVGKGGYTFTGAAAVVAAGDVTITDDPTATDADFAPALANPFSNLRFDLEPAAVGVPCNYAGFSGTANPTSAPNGANGSPNGADGKDGGTWTLRCKGGGDINVGLLSLTGQHGGAGGNGSHQSSTAAVSQGGKGGKGGAVKIQTRGSLSLGTASITTGNGGNGGSANADGSSGHGGNVGASAEATGGTGGSPGLFTGKAGAGISLGGTLQIGNGGRGGDAIAIGGDGHDAPACPPAAGGPATAIAGAGGSSPDKTLQATGNVVGSLTLTGGTPGNGGNADATAGKGGNGAQPCKDGAIGGDPDARGGDGGDANVRNLAGNRIANGGNGGSMKVSNGRGGDGWKDCLAQPFEPGGNGGKGGTSKGRNGNGGVGLANGTAGGITYNVVSNGGDGKDGAGPGTGGLAGGNSVTNNGGVAATTNAPSFQNGSPGQPCAGSQVTFCNRESNFTMIWAASSNDGGNTWTQGTVTSDATGQSVNVPASGNRVGAAFVLDRGNNAISTHYYYAASPSELNDFGTGTCRPSTVGPNTVQGNVTGLQAGEFTYATLGFNTQIRTSNGIVTWLNMPPGTFNVFGSVLDINGFSRMLTLQRNVPVPTTSTIDLNFNNGFAPTMATLGITNTLPGDQPLVFTGIYMPQGPSYGFVGFSQNSTTTRTIQGVPAAQTQSGDLQTTYVQAGSSGETRWLFYYNSAFSNQNLMMPNPLSASASCLSSGGAPVRVRVQGMAPSELDSYTAAERHQNLGGGAGRSSFGIASYDFIAGVAIDLSTPNLSGAGYNSQWGLQPNVPIQGSLTAYGSTGGTFGVPSSGLTELAARRDFTVQCP